MLLYDRITAPLGIPDRALFRQAAWTLGHAGGEVSAGSSPQGPQGGPARSREPSWGCHEFLLPTGGVAGNFP